MLCLPAPSPFPFAYFGAPWRYRSILRQFVRREVLARYRGSMLGVVWAFLTPLLMLAVYTFVFVGVFRASWPGAESGGGIAFALRLFAGLMVFNLFSEMIGRAPLLVLEQPNLVKKVVFPLELLPFVSMGSALFHFGLSTAVLLAGVMAFDHGLTTTAWLLPLMVLPLLPLLLGLSWCLAALGVYVRDIAPMVVLGVSFLLFLSPVFYSVQTLPPRWQFWMMLNPLTAVIENIRRVVFLGTGPNWLDWSAALGIGVVAALVGAWLFASLRDGFADVV
jgi:lipopolysaccharide transport system permease protein